MEQHYDSRCACASCIEYWQCHREKLTQWVDGSSTRPEIAGKFLAIEGTESEKISVVELLDPYKSLNAGLNRRKFSVIPPLPQLDLPIPPTISLSDTFQITAKFSHATLYDSFSEENEEVPISRATSSSTMAPQQIVYPPKGDSPPRNHDIHRVTFSSSLEFIELPKDRNASEGNLLFPMNEIREIFQSDTDSNTSLDTILVKPTIVNGAFCYVEVTNKKHVRPKKKFEELLEIESDGIARPMLEQLELSEAIRLDMPQLDPYNRLSRSVGTLDRIRRDFSRVSVSRKSAEEHDDDDASSISRLARREREQRRNCFCVTVLLVGFVLTLAFIGGTIYYQSVQQK